MGGVIGYCMHCGSALWREDGRLQSRSPAPGCNCALPASAEAEYRVVWSPEEGEWALSRNGEVWARGSLAGVVAAIVLAERETGRAE